MAEALTADALPAPHGFFTRRGGVSNGPYASLNCSLSGDDDRDAVLENRARAARTLLIDPHRMVGLSQVHGNVVVTLGEPWLPGQGPRADAMVTDRPDIALGIVTADCAPVLLADAERNIVGAAHAGWRGAVAGVLEATVTAMVALGARASRIVAAIGPCISQSSYEVGAELRDVVLAYSAADTACFTPSRRVGHWQFDLAGYCAARLRAAEVLEVALSGLDTLTDEARFFSHRRRTLAHQRALRTALQSDRQTREHAAQQSDQGDIRPPPIGHQISVIRPA